MNDHKGKVSWKQLGGIGDEAGVTLDEQIAVHQTLGWCNIELRTIDNIPIGNFSEEQSKALAARLNGLGFHVSVLASTIGNWATPISAPFEKDVEELKRLIYLAQQLNTPFIRIMSYPNDGYSEVAWRQEAISRIKELTQRAADEGVVLLHENCSGWAAEEPIRALDLIEAIDNPALKLLFDMGNPVVHGYDSYAYLQMTFPFIAHIHIKDALPPSTNGRNATFTLPGEGAVPILDCLDYILNQGYQGGISIEPHLALIPHEGTCDNSDGRQKTYIEYAQRFMKLIENRLTPPTVEMQGGTT
jgi:sugar phosphate isomerase/epimerase